MQGMSLKLDISKVYKVCWEFMYSILERFGFDNNRIDIINLCISSTRFSIMINGSIFGFFQSTNGIIQGNPILQILFVLMVELLGRYICKLQSQKIWKGIKINNTLALVTHS